LEMLLVEVQRRGFPVKAIWVGSQGGLLAAGRGECDLAGIHLLDPASGEYNQPFLPTGVRLLGGYGRMQGIAYRAGDRRFEGLEVEEAIENALNDPDCLMVNRNRGSGTRVLIDELLKGRRPIGHAVEPRSHNAVAASIIQGRADWGVAIDTVVRNYNLKFIPLRAERYDFAIPESRWDRAAVVAFREILADPVYRGRLGEMGFLVEGGRQ
jgi:putative molybdopterin biosynthesis protein